MCRVAATTDKKLHQTKQTNSVPNCVFCSPITSVRRSQVVGMMRGMCGAATKCVKKRCVKRKKPNCVSSSGFSFCAVAAGGWHVVQRVQRGGGGGPEASAGRQASVCGSHHPGGARGVRAAAHAGGQPVHTHRNPSSSSVTSLCRSTSAHACGGSRQQPASNRALQISRRCEALSISYRMRSPGIIAL